MSGSSFVSPRRSVVVSRRRRLFGRLFGWVGR